MDVIEKGDGKFSVGDFTIDGTRRKYSLAQIPGLQRGKIIPAPKMYNEYIGSFEFVEGRWVAQKPTMNRQRVHF